MQCRKRGRFDVETFVKAASEGDVAVIHEMFGDDGVDVNAHSEINQSTALMFATESGHITVVGLLLARNDIDVNAQNKHGWTALMFAIKNKHNDIVKLLMTHKDNDANIQDGRGMTALIHAINEKNVKIAAMLLNYITVDVNIQTNKSSTPLIFAIGVHTPKIIELLLTRIDININHGDRKGTTALMYAARYQRVDVVKMLLAHDNNIGRTALMYIDSVIYQKKPDWTKSTTPESIIITELILNNLNVLVNLKDNNGKPALYYFTFNAMGNNDTTLMDMLLRRPDINVNVQFRHDFTLLHFSMFFKNKPVYFASKLLRAGADSTILDDRGQTAKDIDKYNTLEVLRRVDVYNTQFATKVVFRRR